MATPQGFKDTGNGIYEASTSVKTKNNTNELYKFKVNNETGNIDLYYPTSTGDKIFYRYDPKTDKWTIPKGNEGAEDAYLNVIKSIGEPGSPEFTKLTDTAELGAKNVISATSSSENKAKLSETEGYKSSLGNAATTETETVNLQEGQGNINSLTKAFSENTETRKIDQYPSTTLLTYPEKLDPKIHDCIKFTMIKYEPKKYELETLANSGTIGERSTKVRGNGSVVLPIQPGISDTNTVDWSSDTMDAPTLIAASLALSTIEGGSDEAVNDIKAIINTIGGSANSDIKKAVAAGAAGAAVANKGLLTRVTGGIVNPNMELLFNGPQLRSFTFSFSLSARSDTESKRIRNIIRFFKQGMSVKRTSTDLFLSSPHIFEIKYLHKNADHPWINKIKECALLNCSVNYTPAQNYATFSDGAMTSYELSLQFTELEPIYDDTYGSGGRTGNESEIGY